MNPQHVSRFHPALVALHWALAFLIIADLAIGSLALVHIPNDAPRKIEGLRAHMGGGIAILTLMLVRLAIRVATAKPADAPTGSAWLDRVAWLSHRTLYVVVLAMAASGLALGLQAHVPEVVWFGQGRLPADFWVFPLRGVHYVLSRLLMALIGLHIAGALYHLLVRRDGLLRRMWFGRRTTSAMMLPAAPSVPAAGGLWRHAALVERLMLAAPTLLFVFIGWKYVSAPFEIAAGSNIVLGSPAAVTDTRAAGSVFLALGIVTLLSLVSTRRLLAGFVLLAIVIACVTATRVFGALVDGAAPETTFKLVPEIAITILAVLGILLERARRRHVADAKAG